MSRTDGAMTARLVGDATSEFHYDFEGNREHSHGSFTDSGAHTHCICWGAAWRMVEFLRSLPVEQRMEAMGMEPMWHCRKHGLSNMDWCSCADITKVWERCD